MKFVNSILSELIVFIIWFATFPLIIAGIGYVLGAIIGIPFQMAFDYESAISRGAEIGFWIAYALGGLFGLLVFFEMLLRKLKRR